MKKRWGLGVLILCLVVVAGIGLWSCKDFFGKSLIQEGEGSEESVGKESGSPEESLMAVASLEPVLDPDDVMKWGREVYLPERSAEPGLTQAPTELPEAKPTQEATAQQTQEPTDSLIVQPTAKPTQAPTMQPTAKPTQAPTIQPTAKPTQAPTTQPTVKPTQAPTTQPTVKPTEAPTIQPTTKPTQAPVTQTTQAPEIIQTSADPCANGHVYDDGYVWAKSTCTVPGDYCWHCIICGHEKHLALPLVEHQMEKTLLREGDCIWPDEYKYVCANCPHFYYEEDYSQMENRHQWVTGTYQIFDENLLEWVEVTRTRCSKCNKDKE